ncbi:hypothetical protein G3I15_35360 [Streptomyces sp. SID10244]|nr:hypothetical protein [Streptomyces sp. SID10244]
MSGENPKTRAARASQQLQEERRLDRLTVADCFDVYIADMKDRVGVTHQAVNRFVRRHGLAGSGRQAFRNRQARELAKRRQQVLRLVQAGLTSTEVAKCLGVSPVTIGLDRQALRLGRVLKGPERRTLRGLGVDQVRGRLKAVSRAQLARDLGVSSSAVYHYCSMAGIASSRSEK